ncbi:MAG: hypothetical protein RLZZ628_3236 [Bacteroidota bacterium]|jgi:putative acetyltransferase
MRIGTRRTQIGADFLLTELESKATEFVLTNLWSDVSITARPFFQKRGFKITEIYTKWIQEVGFENTIMEKKLKC